MKTLNRLTASIALSALLLTACGGESGFTQEQVDAMVSDAVQSAVADAESELVSEAEAQAKAEEAAKQASLVAAVEECNLSSNPYVTADQAGLVIEGEGEENPGVDTSGIVCLLNGLDTPDSVITRMSNTNSQMGVVEGRWDVYEAEWTYHPDNGLNIFVVVAD